MNIADGEILYIFDSSEIQQREGLVYLKSMPHLAVKELDVRTDRMTQLQIAQLAERMGVQLKGVVREHYLHAESIAELDEHDFLDYVSANLFLLQTPIVSLTDRAQIVNSQFELIKVDGVNSRLKEKVALTSAPD